jgi:hypothetical protein
LKDCCFKLKMLFYGVFMWLDKMLEMTEDTRRIYSGS